MKSVIIYYSYNGNTREISRILAEYLKEKGEEIEIREILAQDESSHFLTQARRAFIRKRARISEINTVLSSYDLVCLGTPVWAFGPAPAVNTYLDLCSGIEGKDIILFTTYGSGAGNERCMNYMQDILTKKGAKQVRRFSIQQLKVKDKEFVRAKIKEGFLS